MTHPSMLQTLRGRESVCVVPNAIEELAPTGRAGVPASRWRSRLVLGAALCMPLFMTCLALTSSRLMMGDYWSTFVTLFDTDGSIRWDRVFGNINEHRTILPSLAFIVGAKYLGGSNLALNLFSVAMGAAQILVLFRAFREFSFDGRTDARLLVLLSTFTFTPHAVELYMWGISGFTWIPGTLLSVLALERGTRGAARSALIWAFLATLSHGTALPVWPILAALFLSRKEHRAKGAALVALGLAVVLTYACFITPAAWRPPLSVSGLGDMVQMAATVLGNPLSNSHETALLIGGTLLSILLVASTAAARKRIAIRPFEAALFSFGFLNVLSIAVFRGPEEPMTFGIISRYAAVPSLVWIAAGTAALRSIPHALGKDAVVSVLCILTIVTGMSDVRQYQDWSAAAEVESIALRLGHVGPPAIFPGYTPPDTLVARLEALDHYPFNSKMTRDCGRFDSALAPSELRPAGAAFQGAFSSMAARADGALVTVEGWALIHSQEIECILILDEQHRVVGAAVPGLFRKQISIALRRQGRWVWRGAARKPSGTLRAVIKLRDVPGFVTSPTLTYPASG